MPGQKPPRLKPGYEYAHTPSGRVVVVKGKPKDQSVLFLGSTAKKNPDKAPVHTPRQGPADRIAHGRPVTKIGWILRHAYPDRGEDRPKPIKKPAAARYTRSELEHALSRKG